MKNVFGFPPAGSNSYESPLVLLIGFLFLIAGSLMLLRVPYLFYQKSRLDNGLEVPAKLLHVKSVNSRAGKSGGSPSVSVEYEFRMPGRVIKGDRASIFSESDGLYFRLREAFETGREVVCFVDSNDPEFSSLEKDVRVIDLVGYIALGIPFSIIGGMLLTGFIKVPRRRRSQYRPS